MSYGGGYKRPRPDDFGPGYGEPPMHYGPPMDYGPPMGAMPGPAIEPPPPMVPVTMGLGSDPDGNIPAVKLRGLPFNCDEREVGMFLEVETVDVVFVRRAGRFSGEAFVVLPGMMQVDFALGKHKAYMGKRYVEVQRAYKEDYYRAIAALVADVDSGAAPPFSRPQFEPRVDRQAPGFGPPMGGNGAGVQQPLPRGPPARAPPARGPWGGGPSHREAPPPKQPAFQRQLGLAPDSAIVKLRGLPFSASREDIAAWFNESGALSARLEPDCVQLVLAYDGRPTGNAFVEFPNLAEASNAMVKDKATMGTRYVELFHSSKEELATATGSVVAY